MLIVMSIWQYQRIMGINELTYPGIVCIDFCVFPVLLAHLYLVTKSNIYTYMSLMKRNWCALAVLVWEILSSTYEISCTGEITETQTTTIATMLAYGWIAWRLRFEMLKRDKRKRER